MRDVAPSYGYGATKTPPSSPLPTSYPANPPYPASPPYPPSPVSPASPMPPAASFGSGWASSASSWPASPGALPLQASLSGLAREYQDRVSVYYDPAVDALQLQFDHCRMHSAEEVSAAFDVLEAKVAAVLTQLGRRRCAMLVDIAGLDIGDGSTQEWGRALRSFLGQFCTQTSADHFLIARYNSRASAGQLSTEDIQSAVTGIQIMTEAAIQGFRSNIVRSREEAVALLLRLRQLAQMSGY